MVCMRCSERKACSNLVNEFDGAENPKGYVYSKKGLRKLLGKFNIDEMFAGYLTTSMLSEKFSKMVPKNLFKPLEKLYGWNLYAKGRKPQ